MLFGFEAVQNNYGIKWLLLLPQHCLSPSVLKGSISFKCAGRYKDGWMDRKPVFYPLGRRLLLGMLGQKFVNRC